ncbi:MAG: 30S ribosomal protein S8e [Methanonatronarchaeales archaeon]|nr:30S ribosomal protein S8e [Methanonatronarchaeales archaeon]
MVRSQGRSRRKSTGGFRHAARKKRKYELGGHPVLTKVGDYGVKESRTRGGSSKTRALSVNEVSVQTKDGGGERTEILDVVENPADPHFVRRNVVTKGCVIDTPLGRCRVTSRPSQEGCVNAVLLDE